jgi:hypothetical protein
LSNAGIYFGCDFHFRYGTGRKLAYTFTAMKASGSRPSGKSSILRTTVSNGLDEPPPGAPLQHLAYLRIVLCGEHERVYFEIVGRILGAAEARACRFVRTRVVDITIMRPVPMMTAPTTGLSSTQRVATLVTLAPWRSPISRKTTRRSWNKAQFPHALMIMSRYWWFSGGRALQREE